jgi:2-succinyl-5-enolpyruvyl-6-hydroxy-3-cyclohexene-1-carboxylate synthase
MGTKETVYCILGDLTTHYDLPAIKDIPHNLKLIIINNFGGRIFETMKLDSKLVLEHENNFSNIAAAFGKSYAKNNFSKLFEVNILEIETNPDATLAFLKEWDS